MQNNLKSHFPMIRDRHELLEEIHVNPNLLSLYNSWEYNRQQEFLNFCTGARGIKLLYDSFFKEVMNPEYDKSRLESLLCVLLKKNVYLVVIYENSPAIFHKFPDIYYHHSKQVFDSGLNLNLLQEFIMIPLDIYQKQMHNKAIHSKLEAWLTFLGEDDPEKILALIDKFPEFKAMYRTLYEMCLNTERVMEMFSEELRILDRNTVKYMIEEQQKEIDEYKEQLNQKNQQLSQQNEELERLRAEIQSLRNQTVS